MKKVIGTLLCIAAFSILSTSTQAYAWQWEKNEDGYWYEYSNGQLPSAGWIEVDGNEYYFFDNGYLATGWTQIDDKWYYFNPIENGNLGALFKNYRTPDGFLINRDTGEWLQDYPQLSIREIAENTNSYGWAYILNNDTDGLHYLSDQGVNDLRIVCALKGYYGVTTDLLNEKEQAIYNSVRKLVNKKSVQEMDEYEKVCAIVEYMWAKTTYKKDGFDSYSPYGALVKGKGVCQGYARTFKIFANALDLDCYYVNSDTHAWNKVRIEGEWYNIDTTATQSKKQMISVIPYMLFTDEEAVENYSLRGDGSSLLHLANSFISQTGDYPACTATEFTFSEYKNFY